MSPTSTLLREKDLELDQLKSELQAKQREDDRRFFVEEAIVFMDPAYMPDGLCDSLSHLPTALLCVLTRKFYLFTGLPISSYVILRALTHWDAFSAANVRFILSLLDAFEKVCVSFLCESDFPLLATEE